MVSVVLRGVIDLACKELPVHKLAGVILDYYDDKCSLIKRHFPTIDSVPDVIKTANVKPAEKLPNEAFALVALNNGRVLRKYACYDPGTTAMSVMYFMENSDKLPKTAVKHAAANLFDACTKFGLLPPEKLTKVAGIEEISDPVLQQALAEYEAQRLSEDSPYSDDGLSEITDITGQTPESKMESPSTEDKDYAVIGEDGSRKYPIQNWDQVKQACDYWTIESRRMHPEVRRQFAVKVASKAVALGYPILDTTLLDAGAPDYAEGARIKTAMDMRKIAFPGNENKIHREFLGELFEKRANTNPEVFAEVLKRFDIMHGLDSGWDHVVPSPWETTFGFQKTARVVWEQGPDRVTDEELVNLARNHSGMLSDKFNEFFTKGFENDPIGVFESVPLPQKRILARIAAERASDGGSFMSSYNEDNPVDTVKDRPKSWLEA